MKSNIKEEIDYNPQLLHKELSRLLCSEDFKLNELHFTDSIAKKNQINGKFFSIECYEGKKITAYLGRVHSCRAGGCSNQMNTDFEAEYEYFDYFILFDSQKIVITVRVYNYEATHGQEITVKGWLNQFIGFDESKSLHVGKEIDSISGATISVDGLVADIQAKTHLLKTFLTL